MSWNTIAAPYRFGPSGSTRRRVENVRESADLADDDAHNPSTDERRAAPSVKKAPSQSRTNTLSDNGAVSISSAFAAQVIGQVLETNTTIPVIALRAYEKALHRTAPILRKRDDV